MATEATDAPQVFARKATGLRREASARDVFIYNTNNQNIGIGVAFVVLLVPPLYVGASMVVATILAGLLALPMACVYAYFAAAMPRSGGDYVYISRTLHPYLGLPVVVELDGLAGHLHRHPGGVPGPVRPLGAVPRGGLRVQQPRAWSATATTSPASGGSSRPGRSC